MSVYQNREAFIPYRRSDIIELCLEDGNLAAEDVEKFRNFCQILSAYYHFQFHRRLEMLKDNFAPFDPGADTKSRTEATPQQRHQMADQLIDEFHKIMSAANYLRLSQADLERFFGEKSSIQLKTEVNFNEFDRMVCYCRGDIYQRLLVKKFFFRKVEEQVEVFQRLLLLLKFKDAEYFAAEKRNQKTRKFVPGKMYLYLYKDIPKFDIEFLFPNVEISMTWKDRLLFGVPAIGAAIAILLRILPQLLLIIGVILFFTGVPSGLEESGIEDLKASEDQVSNFMPVMVAVLSLLITLGGFAFKQYNTYKSKLIRFQKKVTETLFFRQMANNQGVLQFLIDTAEEEECKEIIMVYYHLMTSKEPMTKSQLDDRIEQWMDEKFGTKIDFDINGPLNNLEGIRGKIVKSGSDAASTPEVPLLTYDSQGLCQVLPLSDAVTVIDYVLDNAFEYNT